MAYEFKRLSDVEVVAEPSESANVFIEENGVIKKAPKTAVGGGGSAEWDAVIDAIEGGSGYFSSMELVSGDFESLKEKIFAGAFPNVLVRYLDGSYTTGISKVNGFCYYSEDNCIRCDFLINNNIRSVCINPDGSIYN